MATLTVVVKHMVKVYGPLVNNMGVVEVVLMGLN